MHTPGRKHAPVQGGFLVVRPDMDVYKEYVAIVKKGDFREGGGWGGETGVFYGSMTIQGTYLFWILRMFLFFNDFIDSLICMHTIYTHIYDRPCSVLLQRFTPRYICGTGSL